MTVLCCNPDSGVTNSVTPIYGRFMIGGWFLDLYRGLHRSPASRERVVCLSPCLSLSHLEVGALKLTNIQRQLGKVLVSYGRDCGISGATALTEYLTVLSERTEGVCQIESFVLRLLFLHLIEGRKREVVSRHSNETRTSVRYAPRSCGFYCRGLVGNSLPLLSTTSI